MTLASKTRYTWDDRVERADALAQSLPFAAEILKFYREIALFQKALYANLESCGYESTGEVFEQGLDLFILLPKFQSLLYVVERAAPPELAQLAGKVEEEGPETWERLLNSFWVRHPQENGQEDQSVFFARAFLQPVAEHLASRAEFPRSNYTKAVCPFCERKPLLGILRPEGDGAKRSLLCSLCSTEWDYRRILCPSCGEEQVDRLAVYTAAEFEHVRVNACDTCHTYTKTVDLTKDGFAIPVVDELATIPLNLWAEEKGYQKLQPNLLQM
ncbi:MAG TPA: formate dehydrogenase accessory protein FdhE [Candidatus Angelobacter sp.]